MVFKNGIVLVSISGRRGIQNWLDGASVCKKKKKKELCRGELVRSREEGKKSAQKNLHKKVHTARCTFLHYS